MRAGDILLVRGNGLASKLIKAITHSEYSHVALAISDTDIIEIDVFKKVSIHPNSYLDYDLVHVYNLTDTQRDSVIAYALAQLDLQYDYIQLMGLLIEILFHARSYLNSKNRLICSELIDLAFLSQGVDLVPWKDPGNVTPEDIAESPIVIRSTRSHRSYWR